MNQQAWFSPKFVSRRDATEVRDAIASFEALPGAYRELARLPCSAF